MKTEGRIMKELAIKDIKIYKASSALKKPISDSTHTLTEISFIILRIQLENGIIGESYLLSFQYSPNAIIGALKDVIEVVKGHHCFETGIVYQKLESLFEYFGNQGLLRWSQAAINIAMWDAWGKYQKQPIHKLLGVTKEKVNIYGSGGWISYSIDELIGEVTDHQNFQAYEILKNQTGISLAMGEREFDTLPLRELVSRNALDIWQPDILRIGGVEEWRKSAALADSFHLPVLPHYYKDYDVPLLCTIPNGVGAESFDWVDPLIDNPMVIKDGYATPHDLPGWGFNFIDDQLTEIK